MINGDTLPNIDKNINIIVEKAKAEERKRMVEEINKQDLWLLEATANETESGCPRFIRFNRELINKI